jgi:hypothetical protein
MIIGSRECTVSEGIESPLTIALHAHYMAVAGLHHLAIHLHADAALHASTRWYSHLHKPA